MKVYDGYTSQDYTMDQGWARMFCAPLPDGSCGILIFAHHDSPYSLDFEYKTEANLGLVTGLSHPDAMAHLVKRDDYSYHPSAYRRLARLLENGELLESIKDTLSERGLERAVAFTESHKPDTTRLAMFDRAGFRTELRNGRSVRVLDLE